MGIRALLPQVIDNKLDYNPKLGTFRNRRTGKPLTPEKTRAWGATYDSAHDVVMSRRVGAVIGAVVQYVTRTSQQPQTAIRSTRTHRSKLSLEDEGVSATDMMSNPNKYDKYGMRIA